VVRGDLTGVPSRSQILQARLAAALVLGLIVLGAFWYGVAAAALRDGVEDARVGGIPRLWATFRGLAALKHGHMSTIIGGRS
jgi:hypothetical protein